MHLVCALTGDRTNNLSLSGGRSNQMSCLARANKHHFCNEKKTDSYIFFKRVNASSEFIQGPARPHRASRPLSLSGCGPGHVGDTASVFSARHGACLPCPSASRQVCTSIPTPSELPAVLQAVDLPRDREGRAVPGAGPGSTGSSPPWRRWRSSQAAVL